MPNVSDAIRAIEEKKKLLKKHNPLKNKKEWKKYIKIAKKIDKKFGFLKNNNS